MLKRKKRLARGPWRKPDGEKPATLRRSKPIRQVNPERRAQLHARNYPARPVVEPWCLVTRLRLAYEARHGMSPDWTPCCAKIDAAHVRARGMGGCKGGKDDVVYLCRTHHREQERSRADFETRYGCDLTAEAARVARGELNDLGPV